MIDPSDPTAHLLSDVARALDAEPGDLTNVVPIGNGQVARCERWDFASRSAVVKSPSLDATSRATAQLQHLYGREIAFYESLRPLVAIRTPTPLWVQHEEATDDFVLVLEDLTPVRTVDQFTGLDAADARLALTELAGLHGPTMSRTDLFTAPWLGGVAADLAPLYAAVLPGLFEQFLDRYAAQLDDNTRDTVARLRHELGSFSGYEPEFRCVIHGDYRCENMLFDGRGGDVPLAVVDWQTLSTGSPFLDVAYFLVTSLTGEERRRHERSLLEGYLASLRDRGVTIPLDVALRDYARYTLQPIVMLVAASVIVERTDRGDEMFLTMIRRGVDAATEWRAFEVLEKHADS